MSGPELREGESITFSSGKAQGAPDLRLLHYNDVYHIDPSSAEPVGGVSRFQTVVNGYRNGQVYKGQPELLTLFSGDAFNPSTESSITKGKSAAAEARHSLLTFCKVAIWSDC